MIKENIFGNQKRLALLSSNIQGLVFEFLNYIDCCKMRQIKNKRSLTLVNNLVKNFIDKSGIQQRKCYLQFELLKSQFDQRQILTIKFQTRFPLSKAMEVYKDKVGIRKLCFVSVSNSLVIYNLDKNQQEFQFQSHSAEITQVSHFFNPNLYIDYILITDDKGNIFLYDEFSKEQIIKMSTITKAQKSKAVIFIKSFKHQYFIQANPNLKINIYKLQEIIKLGEKAEIFSEIDISDIYIYTLKAFTKNVMKEKKDLILASGDKLVKVFDFWTKQCIWNVVINGWSMESSIQEIDNESYFIIATSNSFLLMLDIDSSNIEKPYKIKQLKQFPEIGEIRAMCFWNSTQIFIAGSKGYLVLVDLKYFRKVFSMEISYDYILSIEKVFINEKLPTLLIGSQDGTIAKYTNNITNN